MPTVRQNTPPHVPPPAALMRDSEAVITLADHEGLWAHAQSVRLRRKLVEQAFEDARAAGEVDGAAEAK